MSIWVGVVILIVNLVLLFFSWKYLPRRRRFMLYGGLLFVALIAFLYVQFLNTSPFDYTLKLVMSGLDEPTAAILDPDHMNRFFVVERPGVIRIATDFKIQQSMFLDIRDKVNFFGLEPGLLNLAFDPHFAQNGIFYIMYTGLNKNVVLARYHTLQNNRDAADPESAVILLDIPKMTPNHYGSALLFGPDGYLYVGLGDDAQYERYNKSTAQDLNSYLGKILRLDVSDLNVPYKIPADNPYINTPNALPEIWAYGLRNPWRMAFDPKSGDLYISDVGSEKWEEVDLQPAGRGGNNYGWPWFEGDHPNTAEGQNADESSYFVFPITVYPHDTTGGCAIIGGGVYYGNSLPLIRGRYLYSDYCYGYIWALRKTETGKAKVEVLMRDANLRPSSFAVDSAGEFYVLDASQGTMYKLVKNKLSFLNRVLPR